MSLMWKLSANLVKSGDEKIGTETFPGLWNGVRVSTSSGEASPKLVMDLILRINSGDDPGTSSSAPCWRIGMEMSTYRYRGINPAQQSVNIAGEF